MTGSTLAAGDCERIHDGVWAQPVNAASSLAYLAAGAALAARAGRLPVGRTRTGRYAFAAAVAANGVGSVAYHGPGGPVSRWLHDAALITTLGLLAATDGERLGRAPAWPGGAAAAAGAGAALALSPATSAAAQAVLGAGALAGEVAVAVDARRRGRPLRAGPAVAAGALAVAVYATTRTGRALCRPDSLLQGHALWHGLTAALLWWRGRATM
ncbi:MAG TPA: hypothetical protein VKB57_06775 [Acidimicrobiales bacterium]|nr:hypothetical protein [Acidimicrobiales bacterium]